jgi:hypothetical protein
MEAPIEVSHTLEAYGMADEFDVMHDHTLLGPAVGGMLDRTPPVVHTLHGPWTPTNRRYYGMLHDRVDLVAISEAQKRLNTDVRYAGVVHNGIDLDATRCRRRRAITSCSSAARAPRKARISRSRWPNVPGCL